LVFSNEKYAVQTEEVRNANASRKSDTFIVKHYHISPLITFVTSNYANTKGRVFVTLASVSGYFRWLEWE